MLRRLVRIGAVSLALGLGAVAVTGEPSVAAGTGVITGTVADQVTGDPIANLMVHARGSQATYGVKTHDDGSYTIAGLPPGQYQVCSETSYGPVPDPRPNGTGWLDACYDGPATVVDGQTTSGIDFALPPGGAFTGTITDRATGEPVGHVDVDLFIDANSFVFAKYKTRADGTYRAVDLPTGTYYACFGAEGADHSDFDKCYRNVPWDTYGRPANATPIDVVAGQMTPGISVVLPSAGTIAGTVTRSTDGAPVQWVRVDVFDTAHHTAGYAYTDEQGEYRIDRVQPGRRYTVCFDTWGKDRLIRDQGNPAGLLAACWQDVPWLADSNIPADAQPVRPSAGTASTADIALHPGGAIIVSVRSRTTHDLVGAAVSLFAANGHLLGTSHTFKTAWYRLDPTKTFFVCVDGEYASDPADPTATQFGFTSACYWSAPWVPGTSPSPDATPVTLTAGQPTHVTVWLDPGGEISGSVRSTTDGASVPNLRVRVFDPTGSLVVDYLRLYLAPTYSVRGVPASDGDTVCFTAPAFLGQCYQGKDWDGDPADLPVGTTAVPVTASAETTGISAQLSPAS